MTPAEFLTMHIGQSPMHWANYLGITSIPSLGFCRGSWHERRRRWKAMKELKGLEAVLPGTMRLVAEDSWSKSYAMLAAFLFDAKYDSGNVRQTCSMSIGEFDGLVRAYLNDKNRSLSACLVAKTPTALFKALSEGLEADNLIWTAGYSNAKKGRSKR